MKSTLPQKLDMDPKTNSIQKETTPENNANKQTLNRNVSRHGGGSALCAYIYIYTCIGKYRKARRVMEPTIHSSLELSDAIAWHCARKRYFKGPPRTFKTERFWNFGARHGTKNAATKRTKTVR